MERLLGPDYAFFDHMAVHSIENSPQQSYNGKDN